MPSLTFPAPALSAQPHSAKWDSCLSASASSFHHPAATRRPALAEEQSSSRLKGGHRERGDYLHVFAQRAGVRIGLVAHLAKIGLVARVHVHVLLAVAAIGKASVAAFELALEGLLPWCERQKEGSLIVTNPAAIFKILNNDKNKNKIKRQQLSVSTLQVQKHGSSTVLYLQWNYKYLNYFNS